MKDDFDAVLAEVVLGVVDGLEEAVLDQVLGLDILWKVTNLRDGIENHCLCCLFNIKCPFCLEKFSPSVLLPEAEVKLRH